VPARAPDAYTGEYKGTDVYAYALKGALVYIDVVFYTQLDG